MSNRTVKQFNKLMKQHGMELIPRRNLKGYIFGYELYINGENALKPDGYDVTLITSEDLHIYNEVQK